MFSFRNTISGRRTVQGNMQSGVKQLPAVQNFVRAHLCQQCGLYLSVSKAEHKDNARTPKVMLEKVWPSVYWMLLREHGLSAWRLSPKQWQSWWRASLLRQMPHLDGQLTGYLNVMVCQSLRLHGHAKNLTLSRPFAPWGPLWGNGAKGPPEC